MSCSKIFSGDLPELTYGIIKYFQNDFSTLHSCILVNRLWCRLAIPLLWENPFSIPTKNYKFIEIYLHNLNDDLKKKLSMYNIGDNLFHSNTFFNYPSFIKYLNIFKVIISVEKWFETAIGTLKPINRYLLLNSNISASNFERLIYMSLFEIFIKNVVNLHTLEIEIISNIYNMYYDVILELILQNTNFINNIKNLNFYNNYNEQVEIKNRTLQLINSHQNLKKILLSYNNFPLYQSLLLSKDYNCSNTLNTIIFYYINFKDINNLDKIFDQLNVLESIHIVYCSFLNNNFIQQIINLTKPFKLKSLFISEITQIESLKLLFQKSGGHLENFGYKFDYNYDLSFKRQLSELLIIYCNNVKFLDFNEFEGQITSFNLIEMIKHNLNYLSISIIEYNNTEHIGSTVLQNLGQTLPPILEYLNLVLKIKADDFEVFLKNSQDTFIKKLLIMNIIQGQNSILPHIKEYIMKKKRVKYLSFIDCDFGCDKDLFSLKDEVKEFSLYNIKVKSYYNELIDVYYFTKESD
ncbi:hypothetical protein C1646_769697 [Rhizophagus diaphanus]|nr:hypothetical protein C1646_769697 [Rhizophagus diaphanus] [Rhizophagus sp. MUCL 43196]